MVQKEIEKKGQGIDGMVKKRDRTRGQGWFRMIENNITGYRWGG